MFSSAKERVDGILNHNEFDRNNIDPIIMDIHKAYNYLPHEVLIYIAHKLNMSQAQIYSAAMNNKTRKA